MTPTTNWPDVWLRKILSRGYGLHIRPAAAKGHWRVDIHQEGCGSIWNAYADDWEDALHIASQHVDNLPALGLPWTHEAQ